MGLDSSDADGMLVIVREHTPARLNSYAWFFTPVQYSYSDTIVARDYLVVFQLSSRAARVPVRVNT